MSESSSIRAKQECFENLLNPIWSQLARYCQWVASEPEAAHDLMSDTLLLAFQSFEKLRDTTKFKSYLFRIALRLNRLAQRRAERQTPLTDELASTIARNGYHDDGMAAERTLEVRELYEALSILHEKQREAIVLFEISGLSLKEVREVQGGTLSGVKSRIARGRDELGRMLGATRTSSPTITTPNPSQSTSTTLSNMLAFPLKAKL